MFPFSVVGVIRQPVSTFPTPERDGERETALCPERPRLWNSHDRRRLGPEQPPGILGDLFEKSENPVALALSRWFNMTRAEASGQAGRCLSINVLVIPPLLPEGDRLMRKLLTLVAVGVLFSGLGFLNLRADEKGKTITIKGDALCAKCGLKEAGAKTCQNVVVVTKDGKKTNYYLPMNDLSKAAHKSLGICTASKDDPVKVEVTGTCEKKGDKLVLTPTEKIKKIE
jgi:hypothetical protein